MLGCVSIHFNNKLCHLVPTIRIYMYTVNRNHMDLCLQESVDLWMCAAKRTRTFYQAFGVNLMWYVCCWRACAIRDCASIRTYRIRYTGYSQWPLALWKHIPYISYPNRSAVRECKGLGARLLISTKKLIVRYLQYAYIQ